MFEYTYKNFLQFGYNDDLYNLRKNSNDKFWCYFGPITQKPVSFLEECIRAAVLIRQSTRDEIYILFSGGMDSEIVLRSFILANIKVSAVTVEFGNEYNEHDIKYAKKFCKEHNIPHLIVPLNLENEWRKINTEYAIPAGCTSPQFAVSMWLMEQTPGFPVLGSGDSAIKRVVNTNNFNFHEYENYISLYSYLLNKKKPGVPAFLQYTPELLLSFFEHPILKEYISFRAKNEKFISITKYKFKIYEHSFAGLENRTIYSGYEKIMHLDQIERQFLEDRVLGGGSILSFEYANFVNGMYSTGSKAAQK